MTGLFGGSTARYWTIGARYKDGLPVMRQKQRTELWKAAGVIRGFPKYVQCATRKEAEAILAQYPPLLREVYTVYETLGL